MVTVTIPMGGEEKLTFRLNEKQVRFLDSTASFPLLCGGMGSGKTLALILKALIHSATPNNYGLIGREKLSDLKVSAWKDFFDICPKRFIAQVNRSEHYVRFTNGSEILFRQLADISAADIRSLNLGWFAIEQAEEVGERIFLELQGRLRRKEARQRQGFLVANPSLSWLLKRWKQEPQEGYELIETSTFDNADNLPPDYIRLMTTGKPEWWVRQFVYGIWDTTLLSERAVFPREVMENVERAVLMGTLKDRLRVWKEPEKNKEYVIGIDPSEGVGGDPAAMAGFELKSGEQVFEWSGFIPPGTLAGEGAKLARLYNNALVVPEINGAGYATTAFLRNEPDVRVWRRKEYDKQTNTITEKLGFRTTTATKPLLISRFSDAVLSGRLTVHSEAALSEMRTFVYTDDAKRYSMGAERGYHDDRIIACALAATAIAEYAGAAGVHMPQEKDKEGIIPTLHTDKEGRHVLPMPVFQPDREDTWLTG